MPWLAFIAALVPHGSALSETFAFMLDAKYFIKTGLIPDVGTPT